MKRTALLLVLCLAISSVNAQMGKGRIIAGVSSTFHLSDFASTGSDLAGFGFLTSKATGEDRYKSTFLNLLPRAGYFVIDNLAVGLDIVLSTSSEKNNETDYKYKGSMISAGPFARYYYPLEKFYPFAELNTSFGSHKDTFNYGSGDSEEKYGLFTIGGGIGAACPLGERVTFDTMLGYTSMTFKEKGLSGEPYKVTDGGIMLKMGFIVFFDTK